MMNFLYFVILILVIIGYVIASEFGMIEIGQAIDNRNLEEVQKLCEQDKSLWEQASDYVVDTGNVDFITSFLKIGMLVTGYAFLTLCRKYNIVESVVEKIGPSFPELFIRSAQADPILSLEKFMSLLNKMLNDEGLYEFINFSTEFLFRTNHADLIYSRLDAFENGKILHAQARAFQIRLAFFYGAQFQDQNWIESFYDNLNVGPNSYAQAVIQVGREGIDNSLFKRLLEQADEGDLRETQIHEEYADQSEKFHAAIKGALPTAKPGWSRLDFPHDRVIIAKEIFEDNPSLGIFKEIMDIIASYAVYYPHNYYGERASAAKKVVDKITGATSATCWIGMIVAGYVGLDEVNVVDS